MKSFKSVIVVLDKGFVYFGDLHFNGEMWELTNASNIRRYGTERGLGQLSLTGPTAETTLDKVRTVYFFQRALQQVIECDEEAWIEKKK